MILSYIKYLLKAKYYKGHGVHSPFVYKFVTEVVFANLKTNDYKFIENYRKQLLKNSDSIKVEDYGAGSKKIKSDNRQIRKIAKYSSTRKKYGKLLHRIVNYYKPVNIIELGTSLGVGTLYIVFGNKNSKIYSIEGSKEIFNITNSFFSDFNLKNINLINNKFDDELDNIFSKVNSVDLVFFDGNHQKTATIKYFKKCLDYINNDSIFIFDDIHWSKDMEEAWGIICSHKKTRVSIDLFQFGIVFFKKELSKEHFIVRF